MCDVTDIVTNLSYLAMDYNKCNMLYSHNHMTLLLFNYKKRKVKDKRSKEIKVIIAKTAHNVREPY